MLVRVCTRTLLQALRTTLGFPEGFQDVSDLQTPLPIELFTIILGALPALLCRIKKHFFALPCRLLMILIQLNKVSGLASIQNPVSFIPSGQFLFLLVMWILCLGWDLRRIVIIKIIGTIFPSFMHFMQVSANFQKCLDQWMFSKF